MPAPRWLWRLAFSAESRGWAKRLDDPERQQQVEEVVAWLAGRLQPGASVVDLGCGAGQFSLTAADRGFDVVGVDFAPGMLRRAEAAAGARGQRVRFEESDLSGPLPFPDASFDGAICNYVLPYLPEVAPFLGEARRVLRPGGWFAVLTAGEDWRPPGRLSVGSPSLRRYWRLRAGVARTPGLLRLLGKDELAALLSDAGFMVAEHRAHPNGHGFLVTRPA